MKKCAALYFVISLFLISCMQYASDSDADVRVTLPGNPGSRAAQYTSNDISSYEVIITNEGGEPTAKTGAPGETIYFERVSVGQITVDVFALDESDYVGAHGSTTATVKKDQTTDVNIAASLLYKSDFFISGEDGAWLAQYSAYFKKDAKFKSYRNDVQFSASATDGTSVRLVNSDIPYVYVNSIEPFAINSSNSNTALKFSAKASEPTTVNFYFQDTEHEPLGIVRQCELGTGFNEYTIPIPARQETLGGDVTSDPVSWRGILRAAVSSGNGTVTIQKPELDANAASTSGLNPTCYPPNTAGVKVSEGNETSYYSFTFSDTQAYGGLCGLYTEPSRIPTNASISGTSTAENVTITFYLYTLKNGIQQIGSSTTTANGFYFSFEPDIEMFADNYEFAAVLFRVSKPMTVQITDFSFS